MIPPQEHTLHALDSRKSLNSRAFLVPLVLRFNATFLVTIVCDAAMVAIKTRVPLSAVPAKTATKLVVVIEFTRNIKVFTFHTHGDNEYFVTTLHPRAEKIFLLFSYFSKKAHSIVIDICRLVNRIHLIVLILMDDPSLGRNVNGNSILLMFANDLLDGLNSGKGQMLRHC